MSNSMRILVVDDEAVGRQLLEAILLPEGYEVVLGENGEEAVNLAASEKPDMILCDVMMPKLDGFGACKKIRENEETAHIPIFLITALDDRDSRIRGIDAGADDYISKPFDRVEILAKVKNHSSLIRYRTGQNKEAAAQKQQGKNIDESILNSLGILAESENGMNFLTLSSWRNLKFPESQHLFSRIARKHGDFCILLSNHLDAPNAALANLVLLETLKQEIEHGICSPTEIIGKAMATLKILINELKTEIYRQADFAISLIYTEAQNKKTLVSGLNQAVFANPPKPGILDDTDAELQPLYLMGNQDLVVTSASQMFLFSPNTYKKYNQKELCEILNDKFKSKKSRSFEEIIAPILDQTQDVLSLKLTFEVPL